MFSSFKARLSILVSLDSHHQRSLVAGSGHAGPLHVLGHHNVAGRIEHKLFGVGKQKLFLVIDHKGFAKLKNQATWTGGMKVR
jgi:hypothetical protein